MSRFFNGEDNWLRMALAGAGGIFDVRPLSISVWAKPATIGVSQSILDLLEAEESGEHFANLVLNNVNICAISERTTTTGSASSTDAVPAVDVWHHFSVVSAGVAERYAYLDGGGKGSNTTNIGAMNAPNVLAVGVRLNNSTSPNLFFHGHMQGLALWGSVLSDAQVALLAGGANPQDVDGENLIAYWPFLGTQTPEVDLVNELELGVFGATSSDDEPEGLDTPTNPNAPSSKTGLLPGFIEQGQLIRNF